ncbi:MAG: hypothetical protein ACP6IY_21985 [Promethearchaeia archaeon]
MTRFIKELFDILNVNFDRKNLKIEEERQIISKINEFLFTNYDGIGTTHILERDFEYFSEYHKYWEKNYNKLLNPKIDKNQCKVIADILYRIYKQYGKAPFNELYKIDNLKNSEICKIRYFTANQDFRGSRDITKFAQIYVQKPKIFEKEYIYENPEKFLNDLGLSRLSQNDKRIKYAQKSAELLIENNIEPIDLFNFLDRDFFQLKEFLIQAEGSGYGKKKADMFIRDMYILKIWVNGKNFDKIDVASDINTIKVALRTRILKTDIPLVSSFFDIFCYQYGLMDKMNAKAWRQVWEIWNNDYPKECIESPCLMDYLIYRLIGKEICKEQLYLYNCDTNGHNFFWFNSRIKKCKICNNRPVHIINKTLPCKKKEGSIFFRNNNKVNEFLPGIQNCPFVEACKPNSPIFKKLNPPKSISILGKTGWKSAKTRKNEGGGGLMA